MSPTDDSGQSPASAPTQGASAPQSMLAINSQYIKDLSFEAPVGAQAFVAMQKTQPAITVNLDVQATTFQDPPNTFEVAIHVKAECKIGELTGFIAELVYAGLFTVNVPKEHLQPVLLIECPRLLFPFARNILADVTRDGGFPPLMLGLMDFAGLYQARMAEFAKQQGQAPGSTPGGTA
jgi:preprotein translocase subunit SecB